MIGAAALACTVGLVAAAFAEPGAVFTTFNTADGANVCQKGSVINCNIYRQKEYVWLNGGLWPTDLARTVTTSLRFLNPVGSRIQMTVGLATCLTTSISIRTVRLAWLVVS